MRRLLLALALLLTPSAALGQAYKPGAAVNDQNPPPVKSVCWTGSAYAPCANPVADSEGNIVKPADNKAVVYTPGSSLNAVLFSVDTTGYAGVSAPLLGTWSGTVTFQGSNDNSTWNSVGAYQTTGSYAVTTSTSSASVWFIPSAYRYIRAYLSAYTSGTVSGVALLKTMSPINPGTVSLGTGSATIGNTIQAYQSGTITTAFGNTTVVSAAVSGGQVLKASAGLVYAINVTTGATPGYVLLHNSATVPADGAVVPIRCYPVAANTGFEMPYSNPIYVSAGASVSFSTTGCYTKTASATAFIAGDVR